MAKTGVLTTSVGNDITCFQQEYIYALPKLSQFNGAKYGRTVLTAGSSALHLTTVGGHSCLGHGAQPGHLVGAGHLTSGHLGRGHGGHSPLGFWHLLQSKITGCCLGIDERNTYFDKSGTGGISDFLI